MQSCKSETIEVVRYKPEYKEIWDNFVARSKNGTFLFYRDYMEYHSDRFDDYSLLFLSNGNPVGIMPANIRDDSLFSHEGLTFGGIVSGYEMKVPIMMEIFEELVGYLRTNNISRLLYKAIPYIYHDIPSEEDLYALFRYDAKLTRRDVNSAIYIPAKLNLDINRIRTINKAKKNGIVVKRSYDFATFMKIVEHVLKERYGVNPVHSIAEIEMLAGRFPDNIKLFASYKGDVMLAGVVIYENKNVAHAQYIANSDEGKKFGALDIVFEHLIVNEYNDKRYFDFGISTEKTGRFLNIGLVQYKEGFAARTVVHDFYEITCS